MYPSTSINPGDSLCRSLGGSLLIRALEGDFVPERAREVVFIYELWRKSFCTMSSVSLYRRALKGVSIDDIYSITGGSLYERALRVFIEGMYKFLYMTWRLILQAAGGIRYRLVL